MGREEIFELARMRDTVNGGLVKFVRVNAGLSVREVAQVVGVHPTTIFCWEKGGSIPREEAAVRYAKLLFDLERIARR